MCGRFTQRLSWRELHELLGLIGPAQNVRPRYNVAPGQTIAAVRLSDGGRSLSMLRWGLIPVWAKEPTIGYKLINARAETVHEKPSFRAAFRARRCLIPADGFYEWARAGKGKAKQPWLFGMKERRRLRLRRAVGELDGSRGPRPHRLPRRPCAGRHAGDLHHPHDRGQRDRGPRPPPHASDPAARRVRPLARRRSQSPSPPTRREAMTAHPVSTLVNKPANDDARCVELEARKFPDPDAETT